MKAELDFVFGGEKGNSLWIFGYLKCRDGHFI